jgi:coniferyl-aldehyde dehydrogenase
MRRARAVAARRAGPCGIISDRHAARLHAMLDEVRNAGAKVVETGPDGHAIVLNPPPGARLLREEIFGPILPVVTYTEIGEAMEYVAAAPKPLALYLYTGEAALRALVLRKTQSGNVTVNGVMTHYAVDDLPFGGVGQSGIGAYHGRAGFDAMSHAKGVFEEPRRSLIPLGRPGGRFAKLFARYMMR